jgi:hypothetical protein
MPTAFCLERLTGRKYFGDLGTGWKGNGSTGGQNLSYSGLRSIDGICEFVYKRLGYITAGQLVSICVNDPS